MLGSHIMCSDSGVPIRHHHMAHSYCTVSIEGQAVGKHEEHAVQTGKTIGALIHTGIMQIHTAVMGETVVVLLCS